ncbi:hypothetical protein [Diaphorobacter sp.]|uniref:hypothetical protein n=1 Tax=Diaphorobacter sp. TaxID=1934310 RepID=UPI00258354DD|nr:hypothetical protein [Diaphorobacter sp.]
MARTSATDTAAPAAQAPAPAPAKDLATEAPAASPKRSPAKPSKAHVKAPLKAATKAAPSVADKEKDMKAKKPKLVRDSFTIPKDEYAVIETLKERTARLSTPAKKSELLRAGLKVLSQLDDATLQKAMQSIPAIKTGRPKSDKK